MKFNKIYTEKDYGVIEVLSPKYGLFKFIIDIEDIERCSGHHWGLYHYQYKDNWKIYYYAQSYSASGMLNKPILLHRYIMGAQKDEVIDHINFDTFNNRKQNLRKCSRKENSRSRRKQNNNESGYNGVFRYNYHGYDRWQANIKVNGKQFAIGYYENYEDAVKARIEAEKKYFGEFAPPEEIETPI